jgi:Flp pilus assembly protein TadG
MHIELNSGFRQRTTCTGMKPAMYFRTRFATRLRSASSRLRSRLARGLGRDVRGVIAVEFAIIAPVLLLVMICTIDLGMGIYRQMQVESAAQAGAEYAIAHGFSASIPNAVVNATSFSGITASPAPAQFCGCAATSGVTSASCGSTCPGGAAAGTYVTVSAQGSYNTILPYPLLPNTFTFASQSTVRIQ